MKRLLLLPLAAILLALATGCDDNNIAAPSFIHIDKIELRQPSVNAVSADSGFYTSDIRGAFILMKRKGVAHEDTIGLFALPLTAPILYSGEVDYIEVSPAVWQSGQANAMVYYTFYKRITVEDCVLDVGDTLDLGTLSTTYDITLNDLYFFEPFEPTEGDILFDSVMTWMADDPDGARSGRGYGSLHLPDSMPYVRSMVTRSFIATDPSKIIYLEFDSRSDVQYSIFLRASANGGAENDYSVVNIYPSDEWKHLYINLGKTWAWVNHAQEFKLLVHALNLDGNQGGEVRLDNVRLITTSKVL
ncbi:MAG: hypothetical protein IJ760_08405 [Bacteroidales bacterium]|nr:hypothetical protein [Bacteroidales bacterium]